MTDPPQENWSAGDAYERYVGRWSRPVARPFLQWLALPAGRTWTDVGCGTGALTQAITETCAPRAVTGIDRSEGFLAAARRQLTNDRVRFMVGDATRLPLDDHASDATVSGLVLNFVADPALMVREMTRVTKPGGRVAAYVWDYAGGMTMMRAFWDAALTVSPHDAKLSQAERFDWCQPEPLAALWRDQGLTAVEVRAVDIDTVFRDFDDYWTPFLGKQGAAPTYLATLDAGTQERIRAALHARLTAGGSGPIALTARAWAVQGGAPA